MSHTVGPSLVPLRLQTTGAKETDFENRNSIFHRNPCRVLNNKMPKSDVSQERIWSFDSQDDSWLSEALAHGLKSSKLGAHTQTRQEVRMSSRHDDDFHRQLLIMAQKYLIATQWEPQCERERCFCFFPPRVRVRANTPHEHGKADLLPDT